MRNKGLMMPVDYLKQNSVLDTNIDDKLIRNTLLNVQDIVLEPLLGTELYNTILNKMYNEILDEPYYSLVYDYIYDVLICGVELTLIDNLIYRYSNSSVVSNNNQNSNTIGLKDITQLKTDKESKLIFYKERTIKHLKFNYNLYPEYNKTTIEGIIPDINSGALFFYYDM